MTFDRLQETLSQTISLQEWFHSHPELIDSTQQLLVYALCNRIMDRDGSWPEPHRTFYGVGVPSPAGFRIRGATVKENSPPYEGVPKLPTKYLKIPEAGITAREFDESPLRAIITELARVARRSEESVASEQLYLRRRIGGALYPTLAKMIMSPEYPLICTFFHPKENQPYTLVRLSRHDFWGYVVQAKKRWRAMSDSA